MMHIKHPVVSGYFYPAESAALQEQLSNYLDVKSEHPCPKAIITPHAGYIYSGPIAGTAYTCLRAYRDEITRVVLFGPAHRHYFEGLAVSDAEAFATPLGEIPVAMDAVDSISTLPQVQRLDVAFQFEHSLEVQLPFLQTVLSTFSIVPILVGNVLPDEVAQVIESLWDDRETLIVVSSDLSHYHDYETAQKMDLATSQSIEALLWENINDDQACGYLSIKGLLQAAKNHELTACTLDLRNSGDTAGPKDSVVGYGAFHLYK